MMLIGDEVFANERTIIVMGTPRSSASIVSGVLGRLGLFIGDRAVVPVYEDHRLCEAFEGTIDEQSATIISKYNEQHSQWDFKGPPALNDLPKIHSAVRNPVQSKYANMPFHKDLRSSPSY